LGLGKAQSGEFFAELGLRLERAQRAMLWKRDEIDDGR
jgi:hypothetical protein